MTDLVAADVTITVNDRKLLGKQRRNRVTVAVGNGTLTYPSGGIPLPTFASWGMVRNIDFVTFFDEDDASGIVWKYDRANHKLRGYMGGFTVASTAAADTKRDATLSTASLGTAVIAITCAQAAAASSGAYYTGMLVELKAGTTAPAAQTLQGEAVGW
jgi:hypothetical protein